MGEVMNIKTKNFGEITIADEKIILDPGVGFGKTYEMNHWISGAYPVCPDS